MGFYIQTPEPREKAKQLKTLYDAQVVLRPQSLTDVPADSMLVCVVENPTFDAAGLVYNQDSLYAFSNPQDARQKTWLLMKRATLAELMPSIAEYIRGERDWRY